MTVEQLKQANKLSESIEKLEQMLAAYGNATQITVGIPANPGGPFGLHDPLGQRITLLGEEIGDQVVAVLTRRIENKRNQLRQLGVK